MSALLEAALRLHHYLVDHHWRGDALIGPDPGIRFNYRLGRFLKSYLGRWPWTDDLCYLQGQGYWILANWRLHSVTTDARYAEMAIRGSDGVLQRQRSDGAWEYPNPEWRGRVATAEGIWAAGGLLESFRRTGEARFLHGARCWHDFLIKDVGFQRIDSELSLNYFSRPTTLGIRVLNTTATGLRHLADFAAVTGNDGHRERCAGLIRFLRNTQKQTGELPYAVRGTTGGKDRPHFQCPQYNAYQCRSLLRYHELTGDPAVLPVIRGVLEFLQQGLSPAGHAYYQCGNRHRAVVYHTAALGAAWANATRQGISDYAELAQRAFAYVLGRQGPDGGFPYSQGDYRVLEDRRSYPRYLAMILCHLLEAHEV